MSAVAAAGEYGWCESKCVHEHSHDHNCILSAHTRHIRVLPAQQAPVQAAEVEAARHRGPAHSQSHSRNHSHSRVHSLRHNTDIRPPPPPLGKREREDARARAPCAVLEAARSTDPGRTSPDRRTASRPARTGSVRGREYHKNPACQARCFGCKTRAPRQCGEVAGIHALACRWRVAWFPTEEGCSREWARVDTWVVQRAAHQAQVWDRYSQGEEGKSAQYDVVLSFGEEVSFSHPGLTSWCWFSYLATFLNLFDRPSISGERSGLWSKCCISL